MGERELTGDERKELKARALTTDRLGRTMPPGVTEWTGSTAELIEHGWRAAREYFTGKGYTPRSTLRRLAAQKGVCPICGQDQPTRRVEG
jgi:hypothetical protein